ncbi:hypothetical protein [uncultured Faecalicoccus sp.]|uniref:hypothetical protein n=1 Tax=uncultured Faecalicoccus sp. TaxID=1971760 RepID=UPI0025FC5429|nr:hypothetical protein [uncultured Faecalicoccus sp.]
MCHVLVTSFCFNEGMQPQDWIKRKNQRTVLQSLVREVEKQEKKMVETMEEREVFDYMISKLNFCKRRLAFSYKEVQGYYALRKGDICYIDFGQAYVMEIGYLHFGLILAFCHQKAFVVPMTGKCREHKDYIYPLGQIPGLYKESYLFLNDAKWINTARIIDVKGHLDPDGELFQTIQKSVVRCIGVRCQE